MQFRQLPLLLKIVTLRRQGAIDSGARLLPVENPDDLTWSKIEMMIDQNKEAKKAVPWRDSKLNVIIPMAGAGSRFESAGYTFPKPLIDVKGKPMIQVVIENLNIEANYIFIVQKSHYEKLQSTTHVKFNLPRM
jgi:hypothetical protein